MRSEAYPILTAGAATVRVIWDAIREKRPIVPWQKIIWFPLHIPKHSLISWMTLLDRLPTKERLHHMGLLNDCKCVFCDDLIETRDHLFLHCSMAEYIWKSVFSLSGIQFFPCSWDSFWTRAINSWKEKSLLTSILKLALNTTIYFLWDERNKRLFQGRTKTAPELLQTIRNIVGLHLRNRNLNSNDNINITLARNWDMCAP
ncbi:uncharacterized protein LOC120174477 [Hibiscus syriacus]|uniref:uncharacterized protein LOC120174477 n=1 Tax=Hibiscus syriacus TaxID=106335 RepID=UPI001921B458|nr:uncharacterized protein LOC120174477 [Hibiscus syriacus]